MNDFNQQEKYGHQTSSSSKGDGIFRIIKTGFQSINAIADAWDTFNSSVDRHKTTNTDNAVKMQKAETETQKEANRHEEELARIEQEWKKISNSQSNKEQQRLYLQGFVSDFQKEYEKYLAYEGEKFLDEETRKGLEGLRKSILDLTKIIISI